MEQKVEFTPLHMMQMMCRTLTDSVEHLRDAAVCFHARSQSDDDGLFELLNDMMEIGIAGSIMIADHDGLKPDGNRAWPGIDAYIERLRGMSPFDPFHAPGIHPVPVEHMHTQGENVGFLMYAGGRGWKDLIIVAQPHQLPRAMLGALKMVQKMASAPRIYAASPEKVSWSKLVAGSQGENVKPRDLHIEDEYIRIEKGINEFKNLATPEELFHYYRTRDAA